MRRNLSGVAEGVVGEVEVHHCGEDEAVHAREAEPADDERLERRHAREERRERRALLRRELDAVEAEERGRAEHVVARRRAGQHGEAVVGREHLGARELVQRAQARP